MSATPPAPVSPATDTVAETPITPAYTNYVLGLLRRREVRLPRRRLAERAFHLANFFGSAFLGPVIAVTYSLAARTLETDLAATNAPAAA